MKKIKNIVLTSKEGIILVIILIGVSAYFWSELRYPRLNEKGAGAGQALLLDKITERPVLALNIDDALWIKIAYSTVNWLETNTIGMLFGIFLAAILLSILGFVKIPRFKNAFLNTLFGSIAGSPMGLCVNCAAPVAKGLFKGGVSGNFALSVMFSSPKFNIVVFAMMLALFPLYLVAIKYAFTLIFIFLVLPLLTHLYLDDTDSKMESTVLSIESHDVNIDWNNAVKMALITLAKNLWYIIVRVVPFMFLAAILGATVSHLFSFDLFIGEGISLWKAILISAIALFLPMPIGVDILLAEMLSGVGSPAGYVSICLFSLGIYSIYSFFIVWKYFSKLLAMMIAGVLLVLSIGNGYLAQYYFLKKNNASIEYYDEALVYINENLPAIPSNINASMNNDSSETLSSLSTSLFYVSENLSILQQVFSIRKPNDKKLFTKFSAEEFGIEEEFIRHDELWEPFFYGRGITSGDFDNDGRTDLVVGLRKGLAFYKNTNNHFVRIHYDLGKIDTLSVLVTAFADIDNDGWNDLFISTYDGGNYFLMNKDGRFSRDHIVKAPGPEKAVTMAVSFADVNLDGTLDFYLGNWGFGSFTRYQIPPNYTHNILVYNNQMRFEPTQIEKNAGETLSVLFSDFNNDNTIDLLIGNDFKPADKYFLGTQNDFALTKASDSLFRVSPYYTMSVTTADVNNDLLLDTYVAGLNFDGPKMNGAEKSYLNGEEFNNEQFEKFCENYTGTENYDLCLGLLNARNILPRRDPRLVNIENCELLRNDVLAFKEALALSMVFEAIKTNDPTLCEKIGPDQNVQRRLCENYFRYLNKEKQEKVRWKDYTNDGEDIPQVKGQNALHLGTNDHSLTDVTMGNILSNTGWTWNAKFADLDNDQWQDLFAVNGCWWDKKIYNMNYFFKNQEGKGFARAQIEAGLDDVGITHSFLYIDIDQDGDLDIITRSAVGQIYVYQNNTSINKSISIQLVDMIGNRNAVGAKIYIVYGDKSELAQMRELNLGGGFMSYQIPIAHFGLGEHDQINSIMVKWADGETTTINQQFYAGAKYIIERRAKDLMRQNSP